MSKCMKNLLTMVGIIVIGSFLVFLYDCIVGLSDFAGRFNPGLTPWVFWILFVATAGSLGWLLATAFFRPRPMLVYANPTREELEGFQRELARRLRRNWYLKEQGVLVADEKDLKAGLHVLQDKANEEIRAAARRVFIGTAVSQNGRLDSLVVLFLISRLVWRISKLYNQRPHYRELINLYVNIAVTSFLAGSIEEFGIEEYVRELMGPLVAGSAIGAVPGAEAIAGAVTTSILSGSTNSLLTMRCGIVARNYMSLDLGERGMMRRSATVEAGKMFVTISAETVTHVTKLLVKGSSGAILAGTRKTVKGMGSKVSSAAGSVGSGAKNVGRGVKDAARAVVREAGQSAKGVKQDIGSAAEEVKRAAGQAGDNLRSVGRRSAAAVRSMKGKVGQASGAVLGKFRAASSDSGQTDSVSNRLRSLFGKKRRKDSE